MPVCWVAGAAAAGLLGGWLATSLMIPVAPSVFSRTAVDDTQTPPPEPVKTSAISIAPLPPPEAQAEQQATPRVVSGPAHGPAELALLFFRFGVTDNPAPAPAGQVRPGEPHKGSELALQWLARDQVAATQPTPIRPGAPHRPGELYLLLTAQEEPEPSVASRPGAPHTMPEIALLYGVLEHQQEAEAASVVMQSTWWLTGDNDNPLPERAPLPGERPADSGNPQSEPEVAITESGPLRQDDAIGPSPGDLPGPPMIAILIDDLGLNAARSARVSALPGPLTMAFIPYGEGLDEQTRLAAANGHELFLHLPMEPIDPTVDPGPHALLENLDPQHLAAELAWNLDRFSGYVGVNNHMGSLLTQDRQAMTLVMAELQRRNLLFVDSVTSAGSVAYDSALESGIPAARRDVFIDNTPEVAAILAQLDHLEQIAGSQGFAIGIGHPHDATITALGIWLPQAQARGVLLVPASRIIADRTMILAQHANR
jgi:uncharacterized protein